MYLDDGRAHTAVSVCMLCMYGVIYETYTTWDAIGVSKTEMSYPCGSFLSIFPRIGKMYVVPRGLIGDIANTQAV